MSERAYNISDRKGDKMPANVTEGERAVTAGGVATKPLYIKHLSLEDWEGIKRLQHMLCGKSVADCIRHAIRKASGLI